MREKRRIVAAFDFDGTITTKDTLLEFIKFARGTTAFCTGFLWHLPVLIAFKLKLYPNWLAKQKLFTYFFKGMEYSEFCRLGEDFSIRIEKMTRRPALEEIKKQQKEGSTIYVISASISEWVSPWCRKIGIQHVLATEAEIDSRQRLTGRFLTNNCYGAEKVKRLIEKEPDRDSYILYAYGDSRGDKELIEYADKGWYNKFKN